jgi:hypothetical protein
MSFKQKLKEYAAGVGILSVIGAIAFIIADDAGRKRLEQAID